MKGNQVKPVAANVAAVLSQNDSAFERVRAIVAEGKDVREQGTIAARAMIAKTGEVVGFAVGLYMVIASFNKKDDAEDFVIAFMREAEREAQDKGAGPLVNQSAESVMQTKSKMARIIRAVHGWGKGKTAVEGWGTEKVLAILRSPGTVVEKLDRLPSTRTDTPPKHDEVVAEVQKRYAGTGDMVPSVPTMAEALGVPEKVKSKGHEVTLTEADRGKLAVTKLGSQITLCPESHLGEICETIINRLHQSPEESWREIGRGWKEVWVKLASNTKPAPVRTLVKAQTEAKAKA